MRLGLIEVFTPDLVEAAMRELTGRGVVFLHDAPAENALAGLRYAAFQAPGGNVHELIERRPKKSADA